MPNRARLFLTIFGLTAAITQIAMSAPSLSSLREYRWKSRVVHVATPSLDDPVYQEQAAKLLTVFVGLLERDIVVLTDLKATKFEITLIGKDGGKKLSQSTLIEPEELFAIIDAMPMRRDEMRTRSDPQESPRK